MLYSSHVYRHYRVNVAMYRTANWNCQVREEKKAIHPATLIDLLMPGSLL
jgi:hypothetical protein